MTEECLVHYAKAIKAKMPISVFGPAGTGKTETAKDFAQLLGRKFVVLNVRLDSEGITSLLKGVDPTAWVCFDEFGAFNSNQALMGEFYAEAKTMMKSDKEFGLFVTFNPADCKGTQTHPEYESCFKHQIEMRVPNRELIAQVRFAAQGF
jgi:hypothetical protein